jgi:hypothetical protein
MDQIWATPRTRSVQTTASPVQCWQVMNKNTETTKPTTSNTGGATETVDTAELANVTGGCANCGCGTTAAPNLGPFAALSARWRR